MPLCFRKELLVNKCTLTKFYFEECSIGCSCMLDQMLSVLMMHSGQLKRMVIFLLETRMLQMKRILPWMGPVKMHQKKQNLSHKLADQDKHSRSLLPSKVKGIFKDSWENEAHFCS